MESGLCIFSVAIPFAVLVVAFQVFRWFYAGSWLSISILDALTYLVILDATTWQALYDWCLHPTVWIGIHKTFSWLPLSGGSILLAFIVWMLMLLLSLGFRDK